MKSGFVLFIHTFFFFSFTILSLASPFLMAYYPDVFSGKAFVIGYAGLAFLTIGSWPLYGLECPFTVWENKARKREGKKPYKEACMTRYALRWFDLKLPKYTGWWFPIAMLILPIAFGIAHW